ncbi:MAG: hypothetical protein ACK4YT_13825, partial [Sphingomonas sp.]
MRADAGCVLAAERAWLAIEASLAQHEALERERAGAHMLSARAAAASDHGALVTWAEAELALRLRMQALRDGRAAAREKAERAVKARRRRWDAAMQRAAVPHSVQAWQRRFAERPWRGAFTAARTDGRLMRKQQQLQRHLRAVAERRAALAAAAAGEAAARQREHAAAAAAAAAAAEASAAAAGANAARDAVVAAADAAA